VFPQEIVVHVPGEEISQNKRQEEVASIVKRDFQNNNQTKNQIFVAQSKMYPVWNLRQLVIFSILRRGVENVEQFAVGVIVVWLVEEVLPDELVVSRVTIAARLNVNPVGTPCGVIEPLYKPMENTKQRKTDPMM